MSLIRTHRSTGGLQPPYISLAYETACELNFSFEKTKRLETGSRELQITISCNRHYIDLPIANKLQTPRSDQPEISSRYERSTYCNTGLCRTRRGECLGERPVAVGGLPAPFGVAIFLLDRLDLRLERRGVGFGVATTIVSSRSKLKKSVGT